MLAPAILSTQDSFKQSMWKYLSVESVVRVRDWPCVRSMVDGGFVAALDEAEDPRRQVRLEAEKLPGGLAVSRAPERSPPSLYLRNMPY